MNTFTSISRQEFDRTFEIILGEEQTLDPGTIKVLFGQRRVLLKHRITGEIIDTDIYSPSEEIGALLVIENYCIS